MEIKAQNITSKFEKGCRMLVINTKSYPEKNTITEYKVEEIALNAVKILRTDSSSNTPTWELNTDFKFYNITKDNGGWATNEKHEFAVIEVIPPKAE